MENSPEQNRSKHQYNSTKYAYALREEKKTGNDQDARPEVRRPHAAVRELPRGSILPDHPACVCIISIPAMWCKQRSAVVHISVRAFYDTVSDSRGTTKLSIIRAKNLEKSPPIDLFLQNNYMRYS